MQKQTNKQGEMVVAMVQVSSSFSGGDDKAFTAQNCGPLTLKPRQVNKAILMNITRWHIQGNASILFMVCGWMVL